jgi:hypothetical protein
MADDERLQPKQFKWTESITGPFEPPGNDVRDPDYFHDAREHWANRELERKMGYRTVDWDERRERFEDEGRD